MEIYQLVAKRVIDETKLKGISKEELVNLSGVDIKIIDKIFRMKNGKVKVSYFLPICIVLDISMDYLLGMTDDKHGYRKIN